MRIAAAIGAAAESGIAVAAPPRDRLEAVTESVPASGVLSAPRSTTRPSAAPIPVTACSRQVRLTSSSVTACESAAVTACSFTSRPADARSRSNSCARSSACAAWRARLTISRSRSSYRRGSVESKKMPPIARPAAVSGAAASDSPTPSSNGYRSAVSSREARGDDLAAADRIGDRRRRIEREAPRPCDGLVVVALARHELEAAARPRRRA